MTINSISSLDSSIISLLRQEPLSIADIQDVTNVSLPTLRRAIEILKKNQWILPSGRKTKTGGRPATLYGLNEKTYLFMGIHLELPGIHFALSNPLGDIVSHQYKSGESDLKPNEIIELISNYVDQVKRQFPDRHLLGLGIAMPGFIDPASGTILSIGREPQWQTFPLKSRLEAEVGLPVIVENDIDCMAFAEIDGGDFNDFNNTKDLIYLGFTEGVKASFFLDGNIYKGPFGNAGLIGHTTVMNEGRLCSCGKYGCLETVASVRAINNLFEELLVSRNQQDPTLQAINTIKNRSEKFQSIVDAAGSGEPLCSEIVENMLKGLKLAIVNLVYLLQIEQIVIGGALANLPEGILNQLKVEIRENLSPTLGHHLIIRRARRTEPYIAAVGATYRSFYSCIYGESCMEIPEETKGQIIKENSRYYKKIAPF